MQGEYEEKYKTVVLAEIIKQACNWLTLGERETNTKATVLPAI